MTLWEKVIVNLENGAKKTTVIAALFSERVKAEIAIVRLRIRIDELKSLIDEQYKLIGRKVVELDRKDEPGTVSRLVKEDDINAALDEIRAHERDLEDLYRQVADERAAYQADEKSGEDHAL